MRNPDPQSINATMVGVERPAKWFGAFPLTYLGSSAYAAYFPGMSQCWRWANAMVWMTLGAGLSATALDRTPLTCEPLLTGAAWLAVYRCQAHDRRELHCLWHWDAHGNLMATL